ncbi:MAG: SlyX family protein [Paracoccaceae bacterium]
MSERPEVRIEAVEEQIAHLNRAVEELSDVVARQAGEMDRLARRVGLLLEREAGREADAGSGIPLADQKPPHW